jgi:hypothetical protein
LSVLTLHPRRLVDSASSSDSELRHLLMLSHRESKPPGIPGLPWSHRRLATGQCGLRWSARCHCPAPPLTALRQYPPWRACKLTQSRSIPATDRTSFSASSSSACLAGSRSSQAIAVSRLGTCPILPSGLRASRTYRVTG